MFLWMSWIRKLCEACPFDAIHVENGIAVVDKEACKACGKCIEACPKKLIELIPYKQKTFVQCSSHDKGKALMSVCKVGCIGCKLCERSCEAGAITVLNVWLILMQTNVQTVVCVQKNVRERLLFRDRLQNRIYHVKLPDRGVFVIFYHLQNQEIS